MFVFLETKLDKVDGKCKMAPVFLHINILATSGITTSLFYLYVFSLKNNT